MVGTSGRLKQCSVVLGEPVPRRLCDTEKLPPQLLERVVSLDCVAPRACRHEVGLVKPLAAATAGHDVVDRRCQRRYGRVGEATLPIGVIRELVGEYERQAAHDAVGNRLGAAVATAEAVAAPYRCSEYAARPLSRSYCTDRICDRCELVSRRLTVTMSNRARDAAQDVGIALFGRKGIHAAPRLSTRTGFTDCISTGSTCPALEKVQVRLHEDWSAEDLRDPRARPVRPDAMLEIDGDGDEVGRRRFLVEYDRTRRVDKNYDKFRRYDNFLCWWWRHTPLADSDQPPFVLFVCQDEDQRRQFLNTADHELTGHRWYPSARPEQHDHIGRRRILFALERDAHDGVLEAWRLPAFPPGHPAQTAEVRRVGLEPPRGELPRTPAPPLTRGDEREIHAAIHGRSSGASVTAASGTG